MRNAHKILILKPERSGPLGRPSLRWEESIRANLKEGDWEDVEWIRLTQDWVQWRNFVDTNEPLATIRDGEFLRQLLKDYVPWY
jgi:hypothetical protein